MVSDDAHPHTLRARRERGSLKGLVVAPPSKEGWSGLPGKLPIPMSAQATQPSRASSEACCLVPSRVGQAPPFTLGGGDIVECPVDPDIDTPGAETA